MGPVLGWVLIALLIALLIWLVALEARATYRRWTTGETDPTPQVKLVPGQTVNLGCWPLLFIALIVGALVSQLASRLDGVKDRLDRMEQQRREQDTQILHMWQALTLKLNGMEMGLRDVNKKLDTMGQKTKPK
jgi:hypothetical protein